jgi:hypothetical protein
VSAALTVGCIGRRGEVTQLHGPRDHSAEQQRSAEESAARQSRPARPVVVVDRCGAGLAAFVVGQLCRRSASRRVTLSDPASMTWAVAVQAKVHRGPGLISRRQRNKVVARRYAPFFPIGQFRKLKFLHNLSSRITSRL